jgi:hypothetical protein
MRVIIKKITNVMLYRQIQQPHASIDWKCSALNGAGRAGLLQDVGGKLLWMEIKIDG